MSKPPQDRPYVQAWLRRLDRQLSGSGRVSQVAFALSLKHPGSADEWSRKLRSILNGTDNPSAELIADVDQILAKPSPPETDDREQDQLF